MMNKRKVVNSLMEVLNDKKISRYKLSNKLGIANQRIYTSMMEDNYDPRVSTALAVAEELGVPVERIWQLENNN